MQQRNLGNFRSPKHSKGGTINSSQFVLPSSSNNNKIMNESSQIRSKNEQKNEIKTTETAPSFLTKRRQQVFQSMVFPTNNNTQTSNFLFSSGSVPSSKKDYQFKQRISQNWKYQNKGSTQIDSRAELTRSDNNKSFTKKLKSPNPFQNSDKKSIDKYDNIPLLRVRMSHGEGRSKQNQTNRQNQTNSPIHPKKIFDRQNLKAYQTNVNETKVNNFLINLQNTQINQQKDSQSTFNSSVKFSSKCPQFLKKDSPSQKTTNQDLQKKIIKYSNFNQKKEKVSAQCFWPLAVSPIDSNNQEQSKQSFKFNSKQDKTPQFSKRKPSDFLSNSFNKNLTPINSFGSTVNYPYFQPGRLSSPNAFNRRSQVKKSQTISKTFSLQDFQMIQKLGKGSFGDVFLAKQIKTGFLCVLKKVSKKKIKDQKLEHHIVREIKIQAYLNHRHLTSLFGFFADEDYLYLILQILPDGSLNQVKKKKKISQAETSRIVKQVCQGLKFMHKFQIIHRDLKPQNIFMNNGYVKLGDFGCAVYSQSLRNTIVGCLAYISPQQLNNESYDDKIDVWSVGILTYQMLVGKSPFQQDIINISRQQKNAKLSQLVFPVDFQLSEIAKDFIVKLLKYDPQQRMDISQALRHQFITKQVQIDRISEMETSPQIQCL